MPEVPFADEDSFGLLHRAQNGDTAALDALLHRYLPRVRRWAAGRLPSNARGLLDTDDLVQETLSRTVRNVSRFEPRHDASLEMYLRQAIANRLRDELRRVRRAPAHDPVDDDIRDDGLSPLDQAIGAEAHARYERGLAQLRATERESIIARLELGYSFQEVATLLDKPTPDAARVAVKRAVLRLAEVMRRG